MRSAPLSLSRALSPSLFLALLLSLYRGRTREVERVCRDSEREGERVCRDSVREGEMVCRDSVKECERGTASLARRSWSFSFSYSDVDASIEARICRA